MGRGHPHGRVGSVTRVRSFLPTFEEIEALEREVANADPPIDPAELEKIEKFKESLRKNGLRVCSQQTPLAFDPGPLQYRIENLPDTDRPIDSSRCNAVAGNNDRYSHGSLVKEVAVQRFTMIT